jgi:hypothetical protein
MVYSPRGLGYNKFSGQNWELYTVFFPLGIFRSRLFHVKY